MDIDTVDSEEEEAYEPWPGCVMSETGCHWSGYYYQNEVYKITTSLASFFKLDPKKRYAKGFLEKLILEYAESHNGFVTKTNEYGRTSRKGLTYDEALWKLLEIPKDTEFKIYHFEKILNKLCIYDPKPKGCGTYLEDLDDLEPDKFKDIISDCLEKNLKNYE